MNTPRYASAAAKLLAKHLPEQTTGLRERERSVQTIERALRARARRRAFLLGAAVTASAAAILLVAWLPASPPEARNVSISVASADRGAAVRAGGGAPQQASSGVELSVGQRLETPNDGGATLRLSTGTSITLSGRTSFRVDSQGPSERFSLERGELSAHVAKLTGGRRFLVDTPDAEVEVRGTRFRLRVFDSADTCASRTRLEVTEGVVEVRARAGIERVSAGERWPRDCTPEVPRAVEPVASASVAPPHHDRARPRPPNTAPAPAEAPAPPGVAEHDSSLTLQNDLFAQGVALRRQGDVSGALRTYAALIGRFPSSPLAENAMVERLRILASLRDASAQEEAKRYLARYPHGFAVAEARRALGGD